MKQTLSCLTTMSIDMFGGQKVRPLTHRTNTSPTVQHSAGSIMMWRCSAVSGSGALKKVNGKMKKT